MSTTTETTPQISERAHQAAVENQLPLNDIALQRACASYPEELREPVMWLGWFVREKCNRELDALVQRANQMGISTDKTNWSKILRGRWNRDARNQETTPCVALDKLRRHIQQLREANRLADMSGQVPYIMTPTGKSIFDFVDAKRAPGRVNRFGVIVGYTGTQKTATLKEYARRNNHGMCVWMEMPENGSLCEFIKTLSTKYGGNRNNSNERARSMIFETLQPRDGKSFRTIIVENCQGGYKEKFGSQQPIFNFIRRLQEETNCVFILTFTPEFAQRLETEMAVKGYFEQFEGRAGGARGFLRLPDYPTEDDVLAIAEGFALQQAAKHLDYLKAIAHERGRVRRLFEDLQQAKTEAEANKEKLTIDHVRLVRGED